MSQILTGVRIIDLTTVIMGPFATRILADMGADVIKIEAPEGDSIRRQKPLAVDSISAMFLNLNRNKRSVVLDLKSEHGRASLTKLISTADVLIHNLRAPVMERLGFGYDTCRTVKNDLVYCAAYGFGAAGPYAAKPAYDDLIQASSGIAALATNSGGEPAYAPSVICDKIAGLTVSSAVLGALFHKQRTGEGQSIEVPMFETAIDFNLVENFGGMVFEPPKGPPGYARIRSRERRPFATADGYACILPYSNKNWRDFFLFVGRDDLLADERFSRLETRQEHFDFLYGEIRKEAPKRTTQEWVEFCDSIDIPCVPVKSIEEVLKDEHVRAVSLLELQHHPKGEDYWLVRPPATFSASPFELRFHAPGLGEHTREILGECGVDAGESDA